MTKVTQGPCTLGLAADYTGTWVPTSLEGVGTLALVTGTGTGTSAGGGPLGGATTGDWLLVGLLVAWIVWVVIENHDFGKGDDE